MRWLLLLYPWLELLSLIQLGVETTALIALGWVIAMVGLGATMLRRVGTASIARLREAQRGGSLQQHLFIDDMAVVVAALLLIIPGLLSDFFAIVVLIGPLRRGLARWLTTRTPAQTPFSGSGSTTARDSTIHRADIREAGVTLEGTFERVDEQDGADKPSHEDKNLH